MLKRRKESDTYLDTSHRHCLSRQITMKIDKILELSASTVAESSNILYIFIVMSTPAMSMDSIQVCHSLSFFTTNCMITKLTDSKLLSTCVAHLKTELAQHSQYQLVQSLSMKICQQL